MVIVYLIKDPDEPKQHHSATECLDIEVSHGVFLFEHMMEIFRTDDQFCELRNGQEMNVK